MSRLKRVTGALLIFSLSLFGLIAPARATTSLGTTTDDSTFEIETSTSQQLVVNDYSGFNDLTISGFTGNVRVVVTASSGTVKITTTSGLSTITGYQTPISATAATIGFTGTVANAQAGLNSLVYIAAGSSGTGTIQVDVSSAGTGSIAFNSANSHYYEYVSTAVTWDGANSAIGSSEDLSTCSKKFNGMCGYFATVTSAEENAFITSRVGTAQAWLGGNDKTTEGTWVWVGGPSSEKGVAFWIGNASGSTPAGKYANWNSSEPNDSGSNEDALQILSGGDGKWNDLPTASSTMGYVIEYGGLSSDSIVETSVQRSIKFRTRAVQSALSVSSTTGKYLQPLTLETSGGSGTGAISWTLDAGGTASGCSLADGVLSATSLGTCFVTATKAQDPTYLSKSSTSTAVSFKTYLGLTTTNSAPVGYNASIVLNSELGNTSKIEALGFTGNIRAEVVATGGNVQITTTTGVTRVTGYQNPVGAAATSIAFEGTVVNVNNALNSLTYIATAAPSSRNIVITVSPISEGSIAYNTENGHYYQYISTPVTWNAANSAIGSNETPGACNYQFNGLCGYFATVTSESENTFIVSKVGTSAAWLGGTDSALDDNWKWVGGPTGEKNVVFWLGEESGSVQNGLYAKWSTGAEPNDYGSGEDALQILAGGTGFWNDLPTNSSTLGYVVEYGGLAGQTETLSPASRTISITIGRASQASLTLSSADGTFGTPYTLSTSGGSGTGAVTYSITDGTATGCSLDGSGKLISSSAGTCTVTATKAADTNYLVAASSATTITFWDNSIATPTAPTVTAGNQTAELSWSAVTNASSYTVTSNPGGFTCTTSGTSCTISGLTNGTPYTFTVQATNPLGVQSSVSSASTSVTPREPRRIPNSENRNNQNSSENQNQNQNNSQGTPALGEVSKASVGPNGETNTPLAPNTDFVPKSNNLSAENIQVIENREKTSVAVNAVLPEGVVRVEGNGWNLDLSVNSGGEKIAPVNNSGNIVFARGNSSEFEGSGFTPNSIFRVFILSTPIFLGEFNTGNLGKIKGEIEIPDSLPVGIHTLQFHNIYGVSENRVISVGIKIVEKAIYTKSKNAKKKSDKKGIVCKKGKKKVKVKVKSAVCPKGYRQ